MIIDEMIRSQADLIANSSNRVAVCLCVDASESMLTDKRMDLVNKGIHGFIKECSENIYVVDAVDLCIITFGGSESRIIQPFSNVSRIRFSDIRPGGGTPLASAAQHALCEIRKRMEEYTLLGITSHRPWLIIMSDGDCDRSESALLDAVTKEISDAVTKKELRVMCIDMGDGKKTLSRFTPDGEVGTLSALDITRFFNALSVSVATVSVSVPREYDNTDIMDIMEK